MRSLQEYRDIYRKIAQNLGYRGDSVELLVHLLANATYIEEVENISYMEESSLEKARLQNSKIQHCMDLMYSVYRGACPRVYIKFKAKQMKTLVRYSEIAKSSNFSVYFSGYYDGDLGDEGNQDPGNSENGSGYNEGFVYSSDLQLIAGKYYIIVGFISKTPITDTFEVTSGNTYFHDIDGQNLSNDLYIQVAKQSSTGSMMKYTATSDFKDYLLRSENKERYIYDLTSSDYGSRLYFKDSYGIEVNDRITATYFPFTRVSNFLQNELGKISVSFGELTEFSSEFIGRGSQDDRELVAKGLIITKESDPESLMSVHYNANKARYQNSIVRSNEDLGDLLRRFNEDIVLEATCAFESDTTVIYYIPKSGARLNEDQKREFVDNNFAYYVTRDITIQEAARQEVVLYIDVFLTSSVSGLDEKIREIVSKYERSFEAAKEVSTNGDKAINKIRSEVSKISGVDYVSRVEFQDKPEFDNNYLTINIVISATL